MSTRAKNKTTTAKDTVRDAIYAQRDQFVQLAHEIHEHPQLAFTEEYAAARIAEFLADEGFAVRTGVFGLPTAFIASIGNGPLHIAFCAEYDALPSSALTDRTPKEFVGAQPAFEHQDSNGPDMHACGHNLITGAAVAAATGLQGVVDEVGLTVSVFGTPAEEFIGLPEPPAGHLAAGKILFIEAGAFQDVHAALMVHPMPTPYGEFLPTVVYARQRAQFSTTGAGGRSLDAAKMRLLEEALQRLVNSLHQVPGRCVTKPEDQNAGAQADIQWSAASLAETVGARDAVRRCFEEAASSHGVTVEVTDIVSYAEMRNDPMLSASYRTNAIALGRVREQDKHIQEELRVIRKAFLKNTLTHPGNLKRLFAFARHSPVGLFLDQPVVVPYGTDMGDVSHVVPAIHPFIGIGGTAGPHSVGFTAQADTDEAYRAMLDGGVALAWTALDAATDPALKAYLLEAAASRVGSSPTTA
jgi:amidohydrolase